MSVLSRSAQALAPGLQMRFTGGMPPRADLDRALVRATGRGLLDSELIVVRTADGPSWYVWEAPPQPSD